MDTQGLTRIVKGPGIWELIQSLFLNLFSHPYYITFSLETGETVTVNVQKIGREDGSGESWNIWADVVSMKQNGTTTTPDHTQRVKIYFQTVRREGTIGPDA